MKLKIKIKIHIILSISFVYQDGKKIVWLTEEMILYIFLNVTTKKVTKTLYEDFKETSSVHLNLYLCLCSLISSI